MMLHFFSTKHLYNALQFRTVQENVVVSHHQQLTNHQDLVLSILTKTSLVHQLAQLMRNYEVVADQIQNCFLHLDDVRGTELLAGKSSQLTGMIGLARSHLQR